MEKWEEMRLTFGAGQGSEATGICRSQQSPGKGVTR